MGSSRRSGASIALAGGLFLAVPSAACAGVPEAEPLRFELSAEPARFYAATRASAPGSRDDAGPRTLALLRRADRARLRPDAGLARAARELAAYHVRSGDLAPGALLSFLLDSGGAAYDEVRQSIVTTSPGDEARVAGYVHRLLAAESAEKAPFRIGFGEAFDGADPELRHVAILMAPERLVLLEPVPRALPAGARARVVARLAEGLRLKEVLLLGPDLEIRTLPVPRGRRDLDLEVPVGRIPGKLAIQVIAEGGRGPLPVAELELHVGEPLPTRFDGFLPPDEEGIGSDQEAEEFALRLLNADRAREGRAPLRRSALLDEAARAHSRDMRSHGFIAHVSPRSGSVSDRVRARRYSYDVLAENVAFDSSLWDAEEGLMRSLGHRRNLLSKAVTEVGIGVARREEGGARTVWVTQVFARPLARVRPETGRRSVLDRIERARAERGLRPLLLSDALGALAARAASRRWTPEDVLADLEPAGAEGREAWASVYELSELAQLDVPETALDGRYDRIGVGVHQDPGRAEPNIRVVVLLATGG